MPKKRGQGEGTISKRPDGTWWARISLGVNENGKQKRKAFYGKTRKEVQEKLTQALNDINKDTYIDPSKMTVSQWMSMWLEDFKKRTVRPTSFRLLLENTRLYINPILGDYMLKDLRGDLVQKFVNELSDRDYSSNTINKAYSVLHQALEQAVDNELIKSNVSEKAKLPPNNTKERRVLTYEEQKRFIEEAKTSRTGEVFILALYTGLRRGELLGLTWDDIDFDDGTLTVNKSRKEYYVREKTSKKVVEEFGSPKTKSSKRKIPLAHYTIDMLKAKKEYDRVMLGVCETDIVFRNTKGKTMTFSCLGRALTTIMKRADIQNIGVHCLRTLLLQGV